ncbi:Ion channel [Paractinoplanes atraurantiacus]|uniref:Ion channel n=1 Tax=Paractinoplanes atraurantiacus TaxID=1036182 RepID=A0A285J0J9_9ACTN|nr:Ion channel [Actinoplanes atraurantiacus]
MTPKRSYLPVIILIATTYVLATSLSGYWSISIVLLVQVGTVWYALRVSAIRRGVRTVASVVLVLALMTAAWNAVTDANRLLTAATFITSSALYLIAPIAIVRDVARRPDADRELMLGALSAYLMLGMAFGFAYRCIATLQPGPFFGRGVGDGTLADTLFFSFVTLTTTGYGNVVPAGNPGQTLAVLEALVGQLFLVTAVAKVVEAWRPRLWHRSSPSPPEQSGTPAPPVTPPPPPAER